MKCFRILALGLFFISMSASAGVFTMPHFVEPDHFSLGIEPELTFTDGAGIGVNAKYTHGISDLMNVMGVIGTGSGPKKFRIGGAAVFDFFPDVEEQPGVGLALEGIYYRRRDGGRLDLTAVPYIHKAFKHGDMLVEPFAALPVGFGFRSDNYDGLFSVVVGTIFGQADSEHLRYVVELGINVDHADTYIAGGLSYYH